jgi:hypothetical protein
MRICLDPIFRSPFLAALVAGTLVFLYFVLMTYSAYLPPALLCGAVAAYLVYLAMGGTLMCDARDRYLGRDQDQIDEKLDDDSGEEIIITDPRGVKEILNMYSQSA